MHIQPDLCRRSGFIRTCSLQLIWAVLKTTICLVSSLADWEGLADLAETVASLTKGEPGMLR